MARNSRARVPSVGKEDIKSLNAGRRRTESDALVAKAKLMTRGNVDRTPKRTTQPRKQKITHKRRTENSEHKFAFKISDSSSECGKSVLNSNLLVDTGATSHIVSDPSKFNF